MEHAWDNLDHLPQTQGSAAAHAAAHDEVLIPLPGLAAIEVSGADAEPFLQAQLSNDIAALADGGQCLAAYCNPKGRMLALFRVVRLGADFRLLAPRVVAEQVLPRLKMFVLRAKVDLQLATSRAWGITGTEVSRAAQARLGRPDAAPDDTLRDADGSMLLGVPGPRPRHVLFGAPEAIDTHIETLREVAGIAAPEAWDYLDILAGLPDVLSATQELFVPQMMNLDRIGGISFSKGCYPGQEIVARMHYLGKPKRRMFRAAITGAQPAAGDEISTAAGQSAGQVVKAAPAPDNGTELLAVLQLARMDNELLVNDQPLRLLELPYSLED